MSDARAKLAAVLGGRFDDAGPMTVEQFPGGHSNLTYLLRFGDQEFVMRRPPLGPIPPGAPRTSGSSSAPTSTGSTT